MTPFHHNVPPEEACHRQIQKGSRKPQAKEYLSRMDMLHLAFPAQQPSLGDCRVLRMSLVCLRSTLLTSFKLSYFEFQKQCLARSYLIGQCHLRDEILCSEWSEGSGRQDTGTLGRVDSRAAVRAVPGDM